MKSSSSSPSTSPTYTMEELDNLCLQDLFIEQAKKTPNSIAVKDGNTGITLSYKELDDITNILAVCLIEEFDVKPDTVVGILLPRSIEYVIANVAILKAGGAYMPLELVYPKPLLERAVTETNAKLVITNSTYVTRVAEQKHLLLSNQYPFFQYTTTANTPNTTTLTSAYPPKSYQHPNADHLAFVVMSSGTTGTPKGILQTHRAAVHSYTDRFNRFPYHTITTTTNNNNNGEEIQVQQEVVQDNVGAGVFFVWELFRPLCRGATCVVIPDHVLFDPPALTKFCYNESISRLLVTPSLMQLILDTLPSKEVQTKFNTLRYLWFCGEVVSRDLATAFTKLLPNVELMNLYSISECHDVSIGDLKRDLDPNRKYATCGTAISGVTFYIVDNKSEDDDQEDHPVLRQLPQGETGEVYVGGPVVGRGYLNMPDKTKERFVDNPFPVPNGELFKAPTLYKTGDLGRLLPNGDLEVLGRCDFMVKIRGYSVVLGAIETALAKHDKLSSAVVLAVGEEGSREGKKLVSYVVPTSWDDPPSAASVRNFLKDHVPPYAIPSTFCVIDALPVAATAAGKLDRKKLPCHTKAPRLRAFSTDGQDDTTGIGENEENANPNQSPRKNQQQQRQGPTNKEEEGIMRIWCQLLNLEPEDLSVIDDFFGVGGHSLLATRLVSQVNEKFQSNLSIVTVMEHPTIRGIANLLSPAADGSGEENGGGEGGKGIDLQQEAEALDPSIYPDVTRKGDTLQRYQELNNLLQPRVVFLTGATGYLGVHILDELLSEGSTVIALVRARDDEAAKERLIQNLQSYNLNPSQQVLESRLIAVAGDLSQPLLGLEYGVFKSLALEIDSIIHCGAQVNLIKPYASLKESNVLGTQEILRLATTNGFVKTKVKPVHYISTNGIFPVEKEAWSSSSFNNEQEGGEVVTAKEDSVLEDLAPYLAEGYSMTKWVAEQMCTIAESRGLPISVLRPGNMAGSSKTGAQNPDDLNYLLIKGIIDTKLAPILGTNYSLDLTPVDFAASAVVQLAMNPHLAIGQRLHLQNPQTPVPLSQIVDWLKNDLGYGDIEAVSRDTWMQRIESSNPKLASGWLSFEKYFESSTWLQFGSDNLQQSLQGSEVMCPPLDAQLLERWFPKQDS